LIARRADPSHFDADSPELRASIESLKISRMRPPPALEPAVSPFDWEIGRSRWATVRLGRHSKSDLTATKRAETPQGAQLIRRGSTIHREPDHPLKIETRGFLPAPAIFTEFAGSGSLADHPRLSGADRILRIVVGIALAVRDLPVLLDWDWNGRIAEIDRSGVPEVPAQSPLEGEGRAMAVG
jgi:hypothetical protein